MFKSRITFFIFAEPDFGTVFSVKFETNNFTKTILALTRAEKWLDVTANEYDILVIGGGASGLGVALDAQLRGLKTALIEADDFAAGASSASTKLIHGGVRYLEKAVKGLDYGQYKLVKEALNERAVMIRNAPHLAEARGVLLPVESQWQKFYFGFGLKIYDWMAGDRNLTPCQSLTKDETYRRFPALKLGLAEGSILYYDGWFYDAEYAVALARTAEANGAMILNHARCVSAGNFRKNGRATSVMVEDVLTGERHQIKAKMFINCTGAQSDKVRKMFNHAQAPRLRPSKGVHIVVDSERLPLQNGLLIPETADGRVVFVLPWHGKTLIGTTDTETQDPQAVPQTTREDVEYLLKEVNHFLEKPLQKTDVRSVFAGNRPLVTKGGKKKTEALIRNHEVEVWSRYHVINLLGGKWTTYRQMAEDAVDAAVKLFNKPYPACQTANFPLIGAPKDGFQPNFPPEIPADIQNHLKKYGTEGPVIAQEMLEFGIERLSPSYPFTTAEVRFVVLFQMAETPLDVLDRRMRLAALDLKAALAALPLVVEEMQKLLDWSAKTTQNHLSQTTQVLNDRLAAFEG